MRCLIVSFILYVFFEAKREILRPLFFTDANIRNNNVSSHKKRGMEKLKIAQGGKEEKYETMIAQLRSLTAGEKDLIANMANMAAVIKETFNFWWVGFYRVKEGELVLGPFQGPLACTRIARGRGVCGTAWQEARTMVVPDVDAFPGHIACSSASRSEIVIPLFKDGQLYGVLDIDSDRLASFDEVDARYLQAAGELL